MRGEAQHSLPGQNPQAFPHRSPPAAANLAHLYRVNISPSFQRPGPRETDSHLQPPLPSAPPLLSDTGAALPPALRRALLLPSGNAGGRGPPATAPHAPAPGRAAPHSAGAADGVGSTRGPSPGPCSPHGGVLGRLSSVSGLFILFCCVGLYSSYYSRPVPLSASFFTEQELGSEPLALPESPALPVPSVQWLFL